MKSLLKLTLICVLAFFTANMAQAQCSVSMTATKTSENASSITYLVKVTTPTNVGRIVINGMKVCRNTNACSTYKTLSKACFAQEPEFTCTVKNGSCIADDGCVVVIPPGC